MCGEVELRNKGMVALIDETDLDLVLGAKGVWRVETKHLVGGSEKFYAIRVRHSDSRHIYMHRLILDAPEDIDVDHINGDGLDNRRCNLRLAGQSLNQANRQFKRIGTSSRFKGVTWNRKCGKWQAAIKVQGRSIHLGLFKNEWDAAHAYNAAAAEYFGEFAFINRLEAA